MTVTKEDREYVRLAALHLDEKKPGWHNLIDPLTLDIGHGGKCVCAQIGLNWYSEQRWFDKEYGRQQIVFCDSDLTKTWLLEVAARIKVKEEVLV